MFGLAPLPRTLAAALRDAGHKKFEVRLSALRDLGRHAGEGSQDAVSRLRAALLEDAAAGVRAEAALALADAGVKGVLPDLVRAVTEDESLRVRQMCLVALGEIAGTDAEAAVEVVDVVEAALADPRPEIRFQAMVAFAQVGGERSVDALFRALEDPDGHVRYVGLRLAEERWVGEHTSVAPARLASRARVLLDDEVAEVRLAAALLLGRLGDKSGADVLVVAVGTGSGTHEPEDAEAAIELAGELGLAAARAGLVKRAFGLFGVSRDPFAWQAKVALARLGDARARSSILQGLDAWTRDARTLAVAAAGRARLKEARTLILAMRGRPERAEPSAVEESLRLLGAADHIDAAPGHGEGGDHDSAARQDPGQDP
ncbi:MAG: HEAT repeat domain-containing protein [Myxococcales bacterium]|nr:HEAT repeat domain-containing protein [Myxococcales bacterium]